MSLRAKLLSLSLLTLILPWAGWQYAQQMETTLRAGQEAALLTTAEVLGRVVASQPELLYRVPELRSDFDAQRGDLFAPLLQVQPLMDGFPDEWPQPTRPVAGFDSAEGSASSAPAKPLVRLGVHGRWLHAYIEVNTRAIRYQQPSAAGAADRVVLLTRDEFEHERAWSISALAPGPVIVRNCEIGSPWAPLPDEVPYVTGVWRETGEGYAIELRGPLNLFGTQLSVEALDASNAVVAQTPGLGWLHTGSEALKQRLEQYAPDGVRVSVVDTHGWLLARAGSIDVATASSYPGLREDEEGFARSIYRVVFPQATVPARPYGLPYGMWGPPVDAARAGEQSAIWFEKAGGEPSLVRAAVPVLYGDQSFGALVVEQQGEQLVEVREIALTRLLNLTLIATIVGVLVTIIFAARLSHRIRRLSRAASTALTPEGRIEPSIPDTQARDELGALARSYDTLLGRLKEYTTYLQTLGTKLSHELRTPLTIVSSSLENLSSEEKLTPSAQNYLERARDGTHRMHALLTAMSEATRVEQSIEHTERTRFDLRELVANIGEAYRQTFVKHRVQTQVPDTAWYVEGSADLIAQLLDKLMDNAADFTPAGGEIAICLACDARVCTLTVSNDGPLLPPHLDGRLFESLVTSRGSTNGKPHLGLGLYIVRLIVDFHHGKVTAENLADQSGVCVRIELPRSGR